MRKAINFDLSTDALKKHYPSKHYEGAYGVMGRFLVKNGFEHRQYSGYVSVQDVTNFEINKLISEMNENFPWMKKCVKFFDVTNVGKQYDMTHLFTGEKKMPKKTTERVTEEKPKPFTIGKKSILKSKQQNKDTQQKQPTKKKEHTR